MRRFLTLLFVVVAAPVFAEDRPSLRLPTTVFLGVAAADWTTTSAGLAQGAREVNPVLQPLAAHPVALVASGLAQDLAVVWIAQKVGVHHPRLAAGALYGLTAVRVFVVHHNLRVLHP